ncbi:MAG TPA: class D sortase [Patescibacteria group bacterium]|nr:class D sortase [Patescibacteria group bacterium]
MNDETKKDFSLSKRRGIIPYWLKREIAVFSGMFWESIKFILVSIIVFSSVFGVINGPAFWNNVKWWWYVNYVDDHSGSWWGLDLPKVYKTAEKVEPNNTLIIPKIGVSAPILFADSKQPADIDKLLSQGVVHYPDTAMPGEKGNVFITGHSSYYWWSKSAYSNVFSILNKLVVGDTVYVNYNYKRYTYIVNNIKIVAPNDLSVLSQGNGNILTLMTCTPVGTNYKRLIVESQQTDPRPNSNSILKTMGTR